MTVDKNAKIPISCCMFRLGDTPYDVLRYLPCTHSVTTQTHTVQQYKPATTQFSLYTRGNTLQLPDITNRSIKRRDHACAVAALWNLHRLRPQLCQLVGLPSRNFFFF